MKDSEELDALAVKLQAVELPIGVYLVKADGRFVYCSERARQMLGMPREGPLTGSIRDYYSNPHERDQLLVQLDAAERDGKFLEGVTVQFSAGDRDVWVEDYCKAVRSGQDSRVLGYLGCFSDVAEPSAFVRFSKRLPQGFFQLDRRGAVDLVSPSVAKVLGYDNAADLTGQMMDNWYVDPRHAEQIQDTLLQTGSLEDAYVELRKRDGNRVYVSINAFRLNDRDGNYTGLAGTLTDVTETKYYREILDWIPVGTYLITPQEGAQRVTACNESFARIFGFSSSKEMIAKEIRDFYRNPERDFPDFLKALQLAAAKDKPLIGYTLPVVRADKTDAIVEVSTRGFFDQDDNLVKRIGVILDVTDVEALTSLRDDIGNMLHIYSSTLNLLWHEIHSALSALSPDPFRALGDKETHFVTPRQALPILEDACAQLLPALEGLERAVRDDEHRLGLDLEHQRLLSGGSETIRGVLSRRGDSVAHIDDSQYIVSQIRDMIESGAMRKVPSRVLEAAQRATEEVERLVALLDLHSACDLIAQMEHEVAALSEHVEQRTEELLARDMCHVETLVSRVTTNLRRFAASRSVRIVTHLDTSAVLEINQRTVLRALRNLLHNAIKYTWGRQPPSRAHVTVRTWEDQASVFISFENRGVPITEEEVSTGVLFAFGERGELAEDRWRTGTGMGLTDARRIAQRHGGDVMIESRPARPGRGVVDYDGPFITTATLSLPKKTKGGTQ